MHGWKESMMVYGTLQTEFIEAKHNVYIHRYGTHSFGNSIVYISNRLTVMIRWFGVYKFRLNQHYRGFAITQAKFDYFRNKTYNLTQVTAVGPNMLVQVVPICQILRYIHGVDGIVQLCMCIRNIKYCDWCKLLTRCVTSTVVELSKWETVRIGIMWNGSTK